MVNLADNKWALIRLKSDPKESVIGDYEIGDLTENISNTWNEVSGLNSQNPVQQFIHGNSDTISFKGQFFDLADPLFNVPSLASNLDPTVQTAAAVALGAIGGLFPASEPKTRAKDSLDTIRKWMKKDEVLGMPPPLLFTVGSEYSRVVFIESVSNIKFDRMGFAGHIRGVTFDISLREMHKDSQPFFNDSTLTSTPGESRYHSVKREEYFEIIAQREYKKPFYGDLLRQRYPDNVIPATGDYLKLPSIGTFDAGSLVPQSNILRTLTDRTSIFTAQMELRKETLDRHNKKFFSPITPEGI